MLPWNQEMLKRPEFPPTPSHLPPLPASSSSLRLSPQCQPPPAVEANTPSRRCTHTHRCAACTHTRITTRTCVPQAWWPATAPHHTELRKVTKKGGGGAGGHKAGFLRAGPEVPGLDQWTYMDSWGPTPHQPPSGHLLEPGGHWLSLQRPCHPGTRSSISEDKPRPGESGSCWGHTLYEWEPGFDSNSV